jgi:hypothetical protein
VAYQDALTIAAEVKPERTAGLDPVLDAMRRDPGRNAILPFARIPGCHFGRVLFLPEIADLRGRPIAPQLLLLSDCDGSADAQLENIARAAGAGLDRLFGSCKGYPQEAPSHEQRVAFLRATRVRTIATYVHRQGRTVEQIREEAALRDALQLFVDEEDFRGVPATEVRRRIQAFARGNEALRWALEPAPPVDLAYRAENALHFTTLPLLLLGLGPVVVPAAIGLLLLVRAQEERDPAPHLRPTLEQIRTLAGLEDRFAQSGFTAGGFVKPGWVRQAVIGAVLALIGWGTRHLYTRDSLAGVKTIHFARWIPLDGGRRVVFTSNFDGSQESYNNDFIDLLGWGLNLVFSNGYGYPRTRWLVTGGAYREQEFKDYLRLHQIPTPIWYSAYPTLTARNVERNAAFRAGLHGRMSEREAQAWLRLL